MSGTPYHYLAWGLRICSEFAVPSFSGASPAEPDINVRFGAVSAPEPSGSPARPWSSAPGIFRLRVAGVARYQVRDGREITVEPASDDDGAVSAFLVGPVFAACLQQRGILLLHASAVETDAGAALFVGPSGAGKSLVAALLVRRGYRLLADDLTAVVLGLDGQPQVLPAFPEIRLWADAAEALDWPRRALTAAREGLQKYRAAVERFRPAPLVVHSVFALATHNRDSVEVSAPAPVRAFGWLLNFAYGPQLAHGLGVRRSLFRTTAALARGGRLARVTGPRGPRCAGAVADRIERCLHDGLPAASDDGRDPAGWRLTSAASLPHPTAEPGRASVLCLASYPKSGNTWLRALLTNYLGDDDEPASINALGGHPIASSRLMFHRCLGTPSSDLSPRELLRLRPLFHEVLAAEMRQPAFVKVHEAFLPTPAGPLFPRAATAGVIYVVRHPCDVAVSFAHHQQCSLTRIVAEMNRRDATAGGGAERSIHQQLPQPLDTWSGHVTSWLESGLPLYVVRYEDLLADPVRTFAAVLRFVGIEPESPRVVKAVEFARFERLRAEEEQVGFRERQSTAPSFFRSGTAGEWRTALEPEHVRALVAAHGPVMERFGYLRDAEAFLREAEGSGPSRDG